MFSKISYSTEICKKEYFTSDLETQFISSQKKKTSQKNMYSVADDFVEKFGIQ